MFFAACSVAGRRGARRRFEVLQHRGWSGEPVMRNARANARRRIAACKHCWSGCNQAPRPGRLPAASTVHGTIRHSRRCGDYEAVRRPALASGSRRMSGTGPSVLRCGEAEVSRWITPESTVTALADRNAGWTRYRSCTAPCVAPGLAARLGGGCVATDVDAPAGQPGREPGVLALLADGQRQLEIGHHHPSGTGGLVDDLHGHHLGR